MKTGDKIMVRNCGNDRWDERVFLFMWNMRYACIIKGQDHREVVIWAYGKEIPTPQHRPYTMKEFTAEWVKRGFPYIDGYDVIDIDPKGIALFMSVGRKSIDFKKCVLHYKWPDGTPCGVEVTE